MWSLQGILTERALQESHAGATNMVLSQYMHSLWSRTYVLLSWNQFYITEQDHENVLIHGESHGRQQTLPTRADAPSRGKASAQAGINFYASTHQGMPCSIGQS